MFKAYKNNYIELPTVSTTKTAGITQDDQQNSILPAYWQATAHALGWPPQGKK
jgi:hypothetical protein